MELGQKTKWILGALALAAVIAVGAVIGLLWRDDTVAGRFDSAATEPAETSSAVAEDFATEAPSPLFEPSAASNSGARIGWVVEDPNLVEPERLPLYQETFTDARLVGLAGDMREWREGTRVAFEIPQAGLMLESVVERIEVGLAGNISYIGRVLGEDRLRRMVVTVGARNAFAYIDSARGSYEMVGNLEFGWLMSTVGMERHVDYDQPDYYIPDNN